ncbi:hypothetical protein BH20ACI1_BH20ACI1_28180 [soil metagenome]
MEVINTKKIASVELAEVLVSADEIDVYQTALDLVLSQMSEREIENKFGATRDEIEGILEDLQLVSKTCAENQIESVLA